MNWFYVHKGQTLGPVSEGQLRSMIQEGSIGAMDLVIYEGATSWLPAKDWPQFTDSFGDEKNQSDHWVVLIKGKEEYKQLGPMSTKAVLEMLNESELTLEDYVWREGMNEWYRISAIKEFNAQQESSIQFSDLEPKLNIKKVYEETASELLKNVEIKGGESVVDWEVDQIEKNSAEIKVSSGTEEEFTKTDLSAVEEDRDNNSSGQELVSSEESQVDVRPEVSEIVEPKTNVQGVSELANQRIAELKRSLEELTKSVTQTKSEDKSDQNKWRQTESELPENEVDSFSAGEDDFEKTRVAQHGEVLSSVDPVVSLDNSEASSVAEVKTQKVKVSNKKKSRKKGENFAVAALDIIANEFNALFPKGSLLRVLALFLIVFAAAAWVTYSSYKDRQADRMAQIEAQKKIAIEKKKKVLLLEKQLAEERRQQKKVEAERRVPPTRFNFYVTNSDKKEGTILFQTDASKHYYFNVLIHGLAGRVLDEKSVSKYVRLRAENNVSLKLEELDLPQGEYVVRASIEGFEQEKKFFRGKRTKLYYLRLKRHKKEISYWHQKERRALYEATKEIKNMTLQVSSLLSVKDSNEGRWAKVVRNWQNKFKARNANQITKISNRTASAYLYPLEWLDLKKISSHLMQISDEKDTSEKSFKKVLDQIDQFETRVQDLTLF